MQPTVQIDTREWQAAARMLFETSSRTCVDFTNGQALKVALEAIRNTEKTDRNKMERTLGVLAKREKLRNSLEGRTKKWVRVTGRILLEDSFAERIVAKRFRDTGSWWGLQGETLKDKALSLIKARTKSVAFIRSGWIPAVRTLFSVVKKKPRMRMAPSDRQLGQPKGAARPAKLSGPTSQIEATITNAALNAIPKPPATGGNPMPVATAGLQKALNVAAKDMLAELARRLNPDLRKVSAR